MAEFNEIDEKLNRKMKLQKSIHTRNVVLLICECVLCVFLGFCCYTLSFANSYEHGDADEEFYIAETLGKKTVTSTEVVTEEVTVVNEDGSVTTKTVEKVISVDIEIDQSVYRNILIIGTDARSMKNLEQRGSNSDVMIIASINNQTGEIKMVSILRDTILRLEDGTYNKANAQFARSGIADTVSMLNRNFGLNISEYMIVNWYGVVECINQLGGVEIELPNNERVISAFNGYVAEIVRSTGIGSYEIWEPGIYNMDGTQAVAYCRIRYGGFEDEGRALHQRETIGKIINKAKALLKEGQFNQLMTVAKTGLSNVKTNLTLADILYMVYDLSSYSVGASYQFPQAHYGGKYVGDLYTAFHIVDPMVTKDFVKEVKDLHAFLFQDTDYQPTQQIIDIANEIEQHRTAEP